MTDRIEAPLSRRQLMTAIGLAAGSGVAYRAMAAIGIAPESTYKGAIKLEGDPKGASVLVLGAGMAGLTAAYELRQAGYKVNVLEYNARPGGRSWTLRGGDKYVELGGAVQNVQFEKDLYLNPGPWRIPYHHHAMLAYFRKFNVALEPFVQQNHNAFYHSANAFGGKPQRIREVLADFRGHVSSLVAQSAEKGALDQFVSKDDHEMLIEAMREWGALEKDNLYKIGELSSRSRGYTKDPGGGLTAVGIPSEPVPFSTLLQSQLWRSFAAFTEYDMQTSLFQPVGGMDMLSKAMAKELGPIIHYEAKVTGIHQDENGVTAIWEDVTKPGTMHQTKADWCVCAIPLSVLSQINIDVGPKMKAAIDAVPYASAMKAGLQFKRRFWEEDDAIFGGISYTDMPIMNIGYPQHGVNQGGKGVLLGAYVWGPSSFEFAAMSPEDRVRKVVDYGAQIHPQYHAEFEHGVAVSWHRVPYTLGCFGEWPEGARALHYDNLCAIDGRIVLAGEHASYIPAWQEGAVLSALDAITRLHRRVVA